MTIISPERLRPMIEEEVTSLSPTQKRQFISALESAFGEATSNLSSCKRRGGYMVVASQSGNILGIFLEGSLANKKTAAASLEKAIKNAQTLSLNEEQVTPFSRGAVRGRRFIISFAGIGNEEDEAIALYAAIQADELKSHQAIGIAVVQSNFFVEKLIS